MKRIIKTSDEEDAYSGWRRVYHWRPGQRKAIKRRTHKRERHEGKQAAQVETEDRSGPDYRHGRRPPFAP